MIGSIRRRHSVLPGFGLAMGFTVLYLSLIVLLPLSAVVFKSATVSWAQFWTTVSSPRVLASYRLSFGASFVCALINMVFGVLLAGSRALRFPGPRSPTPSSILPFALPTAVAGIALTAVYRRRLDRAISSRSDHGGVLAARIMIALTFIGLPFVVRTVQPVLQTLEVELEEAAASLGASRWQTWRRVIFPILMPAVLTGFALAFGRALGEYGSVIFIAGNMPMKTEIAPLLIITKLEQYDYAGATGVALVMLLPRSSCFGNQLAPWWSRRHQEA